MNIANSLIEMSQADFDFLLKNGRRSHILDAVNFKDLTLSSWGFVKETLPALIKENAFDRIVIEAFKDRGIVLFECDVEHMHTAEVMAFWLWIIDEFNAISELEGEHLKSDPDPDMTAAGISDLEQFGDLNTLDALAGGDVLKYDQVRKQPYHVIFDKQLKTITERRIDKRYAKLVTEKSRQRHGHR